MLMAGPLVPVGDPTPQYPAEQVTLRDKLRAAFGEDCEELKAPLKVECYSLGLVIAAKEGVIEDGRFKFTSCSVALLGKSQGEIRPSAVTTIRSDCVYVRFDRPLKDLSDLGKRRIVSFELAGGFRLEFKKQGGDH